MINQLYLLAPTCLLLSIANCFALDGAWDLLPSPSQYKYIINPITLQFKRQASTDGTISNQLFVYDCFLSQYLYEVKQDELSFYFKTSSLLSQNCSLPMISQTKLLLQSVYYFQLYGDRLLLQDLVGNAVFSLDRQKIDYKNVMVGVWQLFNAATSLTANALAQVNGSMIGMCGGATGLYYKLNLINQSYPSVSVRGSIPPACADKTFSTLMYSSSFFTVAGNRSQLSFYDPSNKFLLKMNKLSNLNYNSSLDINLRQPMTMQAKSSLNSAATTSAAQTSTASTAQTVITSNINIVQPTSAIQSAANNNNGQPVRNSQPVQNAISSSTTQPMGISGAQFQSSSEISSFFDVQALNFDSFSFTPSSISFTPSSINNPSPSTRQANLNVQPNIIAAIDPNRVIPSASAAINQSADSTAQPNMIVLSNGGRSQSVQQPKQLDTSFFSYGQNNDFFGGSFAFSSPTPTNRPSTNNPIATPINPIPSNNNNNNNNNKDNQMTTAGIIIIPNTNNTNAKTSNLQTQNPNSQQNQSTSRQPTTAINTTQYSQSMSTNASTQIGSNSSQLQALMNGVLNTVPISDFVQTGKWQVNWLSGLSYIPPTLRMVYLIFTSTKIILYCPCNTFYTNYVLRGNVLGEINWTGTQNQCQNSQDNMVTDVVFYSKMVRANGNNLGFYFNAQVKMAEFKPFF